MKTVNETEYHKRVDLYNQGLTYHEIAKELHLTYPAVASWFRNHGFKANKRNELNGEYERRYKAYLEAPNDIVAAELCGMKVKSFREWRACHQLASKNGKPQKKDSSYVKNRPIWERDLMRRFGSCVERMNPKGDVGKLIDACRDYYGCYREGVQ